MKFIEISVALYDYHSQNEEELSFNTNDIFYILDKENPDWYKAQLKTKCYDGDIGYVPSNYVEKSKPIGSVIALYDYQAGSVEELSFKKNDSMTLYEKDDSDWYYVETREGEFGLVPSNYVEKSSLTTEPKWAVALYHFNPKEKEETAIKEGEQVLVTDYSSNSDWWMIEHTDGISGLVPASYVKFQDKHDLQTKAKQRLEEEELVHAARLEEEKTKVEESMRVAQLEEERKKTENNRTAQLERERKQDEEETKREDRLKEERKRLDEEGLRYMTQMKEEEKEKSRQTEIERRKGAQEAAKQQRDLEAKLREKAARSLQTNDSQSQSQFSQTNQSFIPLASVSAVQNTTPLNPNKPDPLKTRLWTDNTGAFKVDAQLISCNDGKIRLFKTNGVKIEVPAEKMCVDDLRYIEQETGQRLLEDDIPLARLSKKFSWFDYFKKLNIPYEASIKYAQTFEKEGLNRWDLESLTYGRMRSLGMAEIHIRQLQRFIETSQAGPPSDDENIKPKLKMKKSVTFGAVDYIEDHAFVEVSDGEENKYGEHDIQWQIDQDEKLSRMLQEEENQHYKAATSSNASLKRRDTGRPTPSASAPRDINPAFANVHEILQPTLAQPQRPPSAQHPVLQTQPSSVSLTNVSNFNDEAWTLRVNHTSSAFDNPASGNNSTPPQLPDRPRSTPQMLPQNTVDLRVTSNWGVNPSTTNPVSVGNIYTSSQANTYPNQSNTQSFQQAKYNDTFNRIPSAPHHSQLANFALPSLHYHTGGSSVQVIPSQPNLPPPLAPQPTVGSHPSFHSHTTSANQVNRNWTTATPANPFGSTSSLPSNFQSQTFVSSQNGHLDPTDKYAIFKTMDKSAPSILKPVTPLQPNNTHYTNPDQRW